MTRLTAGFWVQAYLARLRLRDIPAFVVTHGERIAQMIVAAMYTAGRITCGIGTTAVAAVAGAV